MSAFWPGDRVKVRRRGSAPIHVSQAIERMYADL